jgi:inosose dehydratase
MQSRRDFLKLAIAAASVASLPSLIHAAAPEQQKVSLGFSLYGMKSLPISTALTECARIGYRNVELALMTGFPTDPTKITAADRKAIADQAAKLGLKISSLLVNITLVGDEKAHAATLETIKLAGAWAREIDPQHPPIIQTIMGGKPEAWEKSKESMATRLHDWGTTAQAAGVVVAVKGHVAQAVNSPDRLLWIVEKAASPAIVVAYDHSHFELGGVPLADSWRQLASSTRFVHVKEATREAGAVKFLLPGEGTTDYRNYFNLLHQRGYHGPVVVEVSSLIFSQPGYDPIKAAERSYAALAGPLAASDGVRP